MYSSLFQLHLFKLCCSLEQETARKLILYESSSFFLAGICLVVGLLSGLFYRASPREYQKLCLSLFSLLSSLYFIISSQTGQEIFSSVILRREHSGSITLLSNLELLLEFGLPPLFLAYLLRMVGKKEDLKIYLLYGASILLLLFILLLPAETQTWSWMKRSLPALVFFYAIVAVVILFPHRRRLKYVAVGFMIALLLGLWKFLQLFWPDSGFDPLALGGTALIGSAVMELLPPLRNREQEEQRSAFSTTIQQRDIINNLQQKWKQIIIPLRNLTEPENSIGSKRESLLKQEKRRREAAGAIVRLTTMMEEVAILQQPTVLAQKPIRQQKFDPLSLCNRAAEQALLATAESRRRIRIVLPNSSRKIESDPELLGIALYHLMENALLYTVGKVEVRLWSLSYQLIVEVEDEGISKERGPGIGLAVVAEICRRLGGELQWEKRERLFSLLRLNIPLPNENQNRSEEKIDRKIDRKEEKE